MGEEHTTTVDVLSLEDFHTTIAGRLAEAQSLLTTLTTTLQESQPQLGGFEDANTATGRHGDLHTEHVTAVGRLIDAVTAAQTATATILENYRSTEARNAANAADISTIMQPVGEVLNGGDTHAR
jgi:hypothetical protein